MIEEKVDIVMERVKQDLCPFCAKPVVKNLCKSVDYKGKTIMVCQTHYIQDSEKKTVLLES